jgi:outer membrane protein OmpA-like peptidoglycan-associated protein
MRLVLLVFFVCGLAFQAIAQSYAVSDARAIKWYQEGEQLLGTKKYSEALEKFRMALTKAPSFYEAYQKAIQILVSQGKYKEAEQLGLQGRDNLQSLREASTYLADLSWLFCTIYLKQGRFEEAFNEFTSLEGSLNPGFKKSTYFLEMKTQMQFLGEQLPLKKQIEKEKLNSPLNGYALQYFPVLTADGEQLFFTKRDGTSTSDKEDIFYSLADSTGIWSIPQGISKEINSSYNEGTCSVTADGNFLIFTSCDAPSTLGSCDLYSAQKVNGEWQAPINIGPRVNSSSWDSQPSLSADGRILFFSSDRRGGFGGNDIWYSLRKKDGSWSEAKNAGPVLNTAKDEISPFLFFNNETLFFASDGHIGFGGMDIFLSRVEAGEFQVPENLGLPINDQLDQVALFITAQKEYAYYSELSTFQGTNDRAFLYRFNFPQQIEVGQSVTVTQGEVRNAATGQPLQATLSLVSLSNDSTYYQFESDGKNGEFVMLYPEQGISGLYVEKKGFLPKIYNVDRDSIKNVSDLQVELVPIAAGEEFVFENVFFDFDKYNLKTESYSSLRRLLAFLQTNPEVRILITGHTDNIGAATYNQRLSLLRAMEVQSFLLQEGIGPKRIEVEGKGDQQPMVPNTNAQQQALNRRITIQVR